MFLKRYARNPIISPTDIPEHRPLLADVSAVFNPGAVKVDDKYLLLLRVQNRGRETYLLRATSSNGREFAIDPHPISFKGIVNVPENIYHVYDPRITRIGNCYYIMVAMDMDSCCRLGLARTYDFESYEFLGIVSKNDNRNGVLFPQRFDDYFLRLDRPNLKIMEDGVSSGSVIQLSCSKDLLHWEAMGEVIAGRPHYWDELIGAGPPPIKTARGWLLIYHGVATHFHSANIYQAGILLLDLNDPSKVIQRGRFNILEPRELYEQVGQVPNVVFPTGMIVEQYDDKGFATLESEVLIYYGAADTHVGLAVTTIRHLLEAVYEGSS